MNQKPTYSRSKEPRREKTGKSRRDDEERNRGDEPTSRRNSSERSSTGQTSFSSRYKDNSNIERNRSGSRDGHSSLVFRRQERGKFQNFSKGSTPDNSPGRFLLTDTMKSETTGRIGSSHYSRNVNSRDRDYLSKRSGHVDHNIYDDARLSHFLQRLQRDDDRERQISMIRQLKDIFSQSENQKVIVSNLEEIIATFEDFLVQRLNSEFKQEFIASLGTLGSILGNQAQSLFDWEFSIYNSSVTDEVRILILKTIHETLKTDRDKANLTSEVIMFVMSNLQSSLENADIPDLLISIVDAIFEVSSTYPSVFSNHFRDTVDILIGWHIDATQQPSVTEYTSNALISFQQFWISDINFTVTLLGQFLEDMESYAEGLPKVKVANKSKHQKECVQSKAKSSNSNSNVSEVQTSASDNIAKIKSLIRVLITVLKSIGNLILPDENSPITWNFLTEMLKNFLKYVIITAQYCYYCDLMTSANECVCLLLQQTQSHAAGALDQLLAFMNILQEQSPDLMNELHIQSILQVMTVFVKEINTHLPVEFVSNMFASNSLTFKLKFFPSSKVQQLLLALKHAVLSVKNVHVIEEFYKCILADIETSCSILMNAEEGDDVTSVSFQEAELCLLSSLCALLEIGNAKHSIIGMWALKPSFFDLMTNELKPSSPDLATKTPASQYAILFTLYSHSQRHNHFVNSSVLVNPSFPSANSSSGHSTPTLANVPVMPPPSSGNLSRILVLLTSLLRLRETPYESRLLAVQWTSEIIEIVQPHLTRLVQDGDFLELVKVIVATAFIDERNISKACGMILQVVLRDVGPSFSDHVLQSCFEVCTLKLTVHDSEIQDLYASILSFLPLDVITSSIPYNATKLDFFRADNKENENFHNAFTTSWDIWSTRHGHMSRVSMGNFHNHHFRNIMAFILQGTHPKSKDWLLRLFYSCPPPEKSSRVDKGLFHLTQNSLSALWFWATWEVAQNCVLSKLRTPLGKPQDTFMAIEAAIKGYVKQSKKFKANNAEDTEHVLLRVHLLLDLMEHLEKLMYNSYEGCAAALPTPPKTVRTFFRTNKATCQEWLSRVRLSTLLLALQAGQPAAALRQGFEILQEMRVMGNTQGSEFEHVLIFVVKALITLRCPEAVLGLYSWCKDKVGRKFTWIKASVDHAGGRFENAAHEYCCVLHSVSNPSSPFKAPKPEETNKVNKSIKNAANLCLTFDEDMMKVFEQLNLKEISGGKLDSDPHLRSFLINQVTECYINLGSWAEAEKWIQVQQKLKMCQNGISIQHTFCDYDPSYLKALTVFEDGLNSSFGLNKTKLVFSDINVKSLLDKGVDACGWQINESMHNIEKLLLSAAIGYETKTRSASQDPKDVYEKINEAKSDVLDLVKVSALKWPLHIDPIQSSLFISASALSSVFQKSRKFRSILLQENIKLDPPDFCSSSLSFILAWQNVWLHMAAKEQSNKPQIGPLLDMFLVAARLARRQQNLKLCQKLLKNASLLSGIDLNGLQNNNKSSPSHFSDTGYLHKMLKLSFNHLPSEKLVRMQREGAKLLRSWGDTEGAYEILHLCCLAVNNKLSEIHLDPYKSEDSTTVLQELNSRSLLNMVKYLQQDSKCMIDIFSNTSSDLTHYDSDSGIAALLYNISKMENTCKNTHSCTTTTEFTATNGLRQDTVVGNTEFLVGRLLQLSVHQCPTLPKAWCNFASWCYRWGRKVVDATSSGSSNLTPEEKSQVLSLLPNVSKDEVEVVLNIVGTLHGTSGGEWDDQETDYTENKAEETRRQLLGQCCFLQEMENSETIAEGLMEVWKSVVNRTYSYYKMAAEGYLQYLQLSGKSALKDRCEDDNVTATLRLLRLVVKHASELREVLEHGLAQTPTAPWRGIIPQLFSRLSHPEPYVRQSISDLLCRVAQASPHLIVFPAVVGSLTLKAGHQLEEQTSGLFGTYFSEAIEDVSNMSIDISNSQTPDQEGLPSGVSSLLPEEEEESEEDNQKTAIMQNCFAALVETLGRQDGRTISEVKNLVHELHRITLLWDELWLGTLNLHHNEVNRRINNLEKEISKVMSNSFLTKDQKKEIISEKHNVFIKPTLFVLEHLQMITSQPAETPHEQWFQKTFGKHIEETIIKLKNPTDPSRPQTTWNIFKQLHQLLQQRVQQQSRSHLSMDHISPVLASLKNTVIPMPGINTKVSDIITIQSVSNVVTILPTKTKPKKLAFIGSDGLKYTYLFKGLEDLHLDERIMQFLSIVNNMFAKTKRNSREIFYARHYSVTPLGPRSGLIQWVDGATPLFGLYKRWQQRESMASSNKGQSSTTNSLGVATTLRPSEIFYNKLTPLLKEKGINGLDNRKEWPLTVLLDVLKELMEETPNDLLSKELWCSCSSALEWWNVIQTYNHSTAVMSMIGYIIGLGDRHLDNVLIDLNTGEVVHIDYNVCFEKGKNLRVPEKVPFRMTANIETALGITGIEGIFRVSCEHVLKVLRKGRETLLTLLEAFVYDPLVDWTPGNEGGYTGAVYGGRQAWALEAKQTRQNMEIEIALSMFAIRVAEMKGQWLQNKDDILSVLPKLESCLKEWKSAQTKLQTAESQLQEACQEKALLEEAQSSPNHVLYTLPKRYDETTVVKNTVKATKDAVSEKLNECKKWHHLHCEALATVCGPELGKWCSDVAADIMADSLSVASVVEFLQSAGQGQLVQQCEHSESELVNILQQQRLALRNCVDLLTTYATIVMQYGPAFKEQNRNYKWKLWMENLLEDFTVPKCQELIKDFHSQYGIESIDMLSIQSAMALHFQLQSAIAEVNTRLISVLEKQRLEGLENPNSLPTYVAEARSAISCFLSENGECGHYSLTCVVVTALCAVNKRLIMMESAAAAAGESLVDLTSWGGDWFLDEIYSMCGNMSQLMSLLHGSLPKEKDEGKGILQGVELAHCVFNAVEDLSLNFQSIILPEAVKTFQAQEPSVAEIASQLDVLIMSCGMKLDRLISELETNIRNVIMEIKTNDNKTSDTVQKLKNEFESLMKGSKPEISDLSRGQMLLMGFNGLFTKVDSDLETLFSFLDSQNQPLAWRNIDIVRDAVALTPAAHLPVTRVILKDIFFLRKLLAIQKFFHLCHDSASALRISGHPNKLERDILIVHDHQLFQPVKVFVAEYVRRMVLGLTSQAVANSLCYLIDCLGLNVTAEIEFRDIGVENKVAIEELAKKAVDLCMNEKFSSGQLTQISTLISTFDTAWRKEDMSRRLEQATLVLKGSLHRAQLQLTRFQWLNEDLLVQGNIGPLQSLAVPTRASIMSEMRKTVQTLMSFEQAISAGQDRYIAFTSSIEQRLKWAIGANPSLATVQEEFEAAIGERTSVVTNANQLSRELVNVCNSILHFEALRTRTTEALSSDNAFLSLINRCQETCMLLETCCSNVSSAEEHLISLKPLPDKGVTPEWIVCVIEKVDQSLATCREKLEEEKSTTYMNWEAIRNEVISLHDLLSSHHKLMSEVRHILRNLAKHEEQELGLELKTEGPVHTYITLYKGFSEHISSMVSKLLSDGQEIESSVLDAVQSQISDLCVTTSDVYTQLLDLAGPVGSRKEGSGGSQNTGYKSRALAKYSCEKKRSDLSRKSNNSSLTDVNGKISPTNLSSKCTRSDMKKISVARDPRTGKAIQERNTYATNVWKRVKMKLDGKDPDPNKKSTIAEQVDFVIREATNLENLAVLYEGWTPWV